jgi:hypothetical protein
VIVVYIALLLLSVKIKCDLFQRFFWVVSPPKLSVPRILDPVFVCYGGTLSRAVRTMESFVGVYSCGVVWCVVMECIELWDNLFVSDGVFSHTV